VLIMEVHNYKFNLQRRPFYGRNEAEMHVLIVNIFIFKFQSFAQFSIATVTNSQHVKNLTSCPDTMATYRHE
jgi:hypothetical protein